MKITVRYTGQLKAVTQSIAETFDMNEESGTFDLVSEVVRRYGDAVGAMLLTENGDIQRALMVVVNDAQTPTTMAVRLNEGDVVTLVPPISGG